MQGGILPPIFGLGPWDGAQVVSLRSPIVRPGHWPIIDLLYRFDNRFEPLS
jgi:hypothetical protein